MASQQGVTLLETMIGIIVMILFLTLGMPLFQQGHISRQLDTQYRDLVALIQQAQMASLDSGVPWTLCGSLDGHTCDDRWETMLIVDDGGQVHYRADRHEQVRVRWEGLGDALTFHPRLASSRLNGTFHLCSTAPDTQKGIKIVINRLGRIRQQTLDDQEDC